MSWAIIERKHAARYKRDFVLCREEEERNFLINAIVETFPFIKREEVERTFDQFCNMAVQPAERELFLARVKEHLGKQITFNYVQAYETMLTYKKP
jgi:hypothetical protein